MASIIEESRKSKQSGIFGFWRNKKFIYILLAAAVLISAGWYYFSGDKAQAPDSAQAPKEWTVRQDDIIVSIEADGKVVAKDGVELSSAVSGDNLEVDQVFVKEGAKVSKGDKIASVKTDTLEFNMRSAYSSYQSSLADYNETIAGASEEQKADAQDKITAAQMSLDQAKADLEEVKRNSEDSVYRAEQALKIAKKNLDDNKDADNSAEVGDAYEALMETIKSTNVSLEAMLKDSDGILGVDIVASNDDFEGYLGVKNTIFLGKALDSYKLAKNDTAKLDYYSLNLAIGSENALIDDAAKQAGSALRSIESLLNDVKAVLDNSITAADFTQADLDGLLATINSDRASIITKISALNVKEKAVAAAKDELGDYADAYSDALRDLKNAKAGRERSNADAEANIVGKELSLEQVRRDYADLTAPLTEAELASARSRLTSASVSLEKARFEYGKSILVSPIDGQIAELNYAAGDIITDNALPVAAIINNDTLFIEANIEEADVSKLGTGQKAYAGFDSLDGLRLEGEISFISLTSKTSNNGIVTYLVRVIFQKGENQIREGMTASIDFVASEIKDVLIVPVNSVRNIEGKPSVRMKTSEWAAVVTGLADSKNVEVISGLKAGDVILY